MNYPINVTKTVILSVLLVAGLITNIVAMLIISKKKFRKNPINRHLWCLSIIDVITLLGYIPNLFTSENCKQTNYYKAIYKAYIKSNLVYYGKYLTLYILLNLTIDRFMGICKKECYKAVLKYSKSRLLIIWAWVTVSVIPGIMWAKIENLGDVYEARSITRVVETNQIKAYKNYLLWTMLICPSAVLIALSCTITYNVIKVTKHSRYRSVYLRNTLAVLCCNMSFIGVMAICGGLLYGVNYQSDCYSSSHTEATLLIGQGIMISWSIFNMLSFLTICQDYKKASKQMLRKFRLSEGTSLAQVQIAHLVNKWKMNKAYEG